MKKTLSILTLLCIQAFIFTAFGQTVNQVYAPVPPTLFPALNNNLNSKPSFTGGVGAPTSGCTANKDLYVASNGDFYVCVATDNNWVLQGSGINALTGDVTAGPGSGSQAATLATVNSGPGTCGDSTHVCALTTNGKGLVTNQTAVSVVPTLVVSVVSAPYNAICDGTGNQTAAINAAITAVSAAGGGVVTAPAGVNCRITAAALMKSNVTLFGQWTITQATAGVEAINVQSGASNVGLNGITVSGAGLHMTSGPVSGVRVSNTTFKNNTNTAGSGYNISVYASFPLTDAIFTGNRFTDVNGGYEIHTAHGVKMDKDVFTNIGRAGIEADAIYFLNTGANPADTNCSNGIVATNFTATGLTRMLFESQGCYVDPVRVDKATASGWSGSALSFLSFGISINHLPTLATSAGAIITNADITGAGALVTTPQVGIEIASPGVTLIGNAVQNMPKSVWATTGAGGNYNAKLQGNTFTRNNIAIDVAFDGTEFDISGNTFSENNNDLYYEAGTSCKASFVNNTSTRTPVNTDSGNIFAWISDNAPSNCPRTFRDNKVTWPAGTVPGGAFYVATSHPVSSAQPGTIYDNNIFRNDNTGAASQFYGYLCTTTEFNAVTITNAKVVNVGNPMTCPSAAVTFYNNQAIGSTPATAQIFAGISLAVKTFATLDTSAPNGTLAYCSDCTAANPVAGSGPGTVARRENGAWNGGGSGGGAPISGATTNACVSAASATTIQTPSANCLIDPATGNISAPVVTSGTPSAGTIAALPPGSHGFSCDESTTAGVPASGTDYVRCDGTTHTLLQSLNGGAEAILSTTTRNAAAFTPGTGVTSATCTSATCTSARGTLSIVGGTGTTGTIVGVAWTATPSAQVCTATMNGGTGFLGIGNSIATTTGFNITAGVTVIGVTFSVNYSCQL